MARERAVMGVVVTALAVAVVWWSPSYDGGSRVDRPDHRITEVSRVGDGAAPGGEPSDGGQSTVVELVEVDAASSD